jgi:hypothetical protein
MASLTNKTEKRRAAKAKKLATKRRRSVARSDRKPKKAGIVAIN